MFCTLVVCTLLCLVGSAVAQLYINCTDGKSFADALNTACFDGAPSDCERTDETPWTGDLLGLDVFPATTCACAAVFTDCAASYGCVPSQATLAECSEPCTAAQCGSQLTTVSVTTTEVATATSNTESNAGATTAETTTTALGAEGTSGTSGTSGESATTMASVGIDIDEEHHSTSSNPQMIPNGGLPSWAVGLLAAGGVCCLLAFVVLAVVATTRGGRNRNSHALPLGGGTLQDNELPGAMTSGDSTIGRTFVETERGVGEEQVPRQSHDDDGRRAHRPLSTIEQKKAGYDAAPLSGEYDRVPGTSTMNTDLKSSTMDTRSSSSSSSKSRKKRRDKGYDQVPNNSANGYDAMPSSPDIHYDEPGAELK
eukprot:TRINITY_DN50_c0_g2_i4.p1 TRINITY_DN50_c0_g2~~TRINITY_DN50_c0_g2_i4.p1  ORF type:complete len:369 (-),score=112.99 TRINITY_DN50_c0_g2_i4:103-1209(-)